MRCAWLLVLALPVSAQAAGVCELVPAGTISALIGESPKGKEVEQIPGIKSCIWESGRKSVRFNGMNSKDADKLRQQVVQMMESLAKPIEKQGGKQEKRIIGSATCYVIEQTPKLRSPATAECFTSSGDRWADLGITMTEVIGSARVEQMAKAVAEVSGKL